MDRGDYSPGIIIAYLGELIKDLATLTICRTVIGVNDVLSLCSMFMPTKAPYLVD